MSSIDYVPIPPPPPKASATPPKLTADQEEKYTKVYEHFTKAGYALPGEEKSEFTEEEEFWLSYECMLRYLRATKWDVQKAIERLESTLKWRREFGVYTHTPEYLEPEFLTGKQLLFGYDSQNRPALYMFPSRQNTETSDRQIHQVVWTLERAADLMGPGTETLALMIDYGEKGGKSGPPFSTSLKVLNILQDHYPERLGRAFVINVPFLLNAFYKMITPFMDPVTREKLKFNPSCVKDGHFEADMLVKGNWGGSRTVEYVHEKFWPAWLKLTWERREKHKENWRKLGGKIGIREWDYKIETPDLVETEVEEKDEKVEMSVAVAVQA